jgi:hypothetical protein
MVPSERPVQQRIPTVSTRRTEVPQPVSTESILGFMDAMQLREVGKLVA